MGSNLDRHGIVDLRVVSNCDDVGALQIPWRPYSRLGIDVTAWADLCSEGAEDECTPAMHRPRRRSEHQGAGDGPGSTANAHAQSRVGRQIRIGFCVAHLSIALDANVILDRRASPAQTASSIGRVFL